MKLILKIIGIPSVLIPIIIYSISCKGPSQGEQLAIIYCSACHQFPKPNLLDKSTWKNGVLPQMAMWVGVHPIEESSRYSFDEMTEINSLGVLPTQSMMSEKDWDLIVEYYLKNAPDKLPSNPPINYLPLDSIFSVKKYPFPDNELTLLKYDKLHHQLSVGTRQGDFMKVQPSNGKILDKFELHRPSTDIEFRKDGTFGLTVCGRLEPNNGKNSSCLLTNIVKGKLVTTDTIKQLQRPVSLAFADFNQDQKEDVVIASFGYFAGKLAWYELPPNAPPVEHILKKVAGATCVSVQDMNKDGLPDIVVLMGQANEGIFIFYNQGKGEFLEEQVLKFPPVYGSINMDLKDFNNDGFVDIIYSNGDNGDESQIMKPYHGVRIFLNDGKNHFTEKYFFPLHGIIKSVARDFDGDGDLDIAAISFFPEYENSPQKSFVYLRNEGKSATNSYQFTPFISSKTDVGRWMVMESLDYNNDGKEDLLLGACYDQVRIKKTKNALPKVPLLVLENKMKLRK